VTGSNNTAVGITSGSQVTGSSNVAIGDTSGGIVTGSFNTGVGFVAGTGVTGDNNVAIGKQAAQNITASNTVAIGTKALASANGAVAIGNGAQATRQNQVVLGTGAYTYTLPGITSAASSAAQTGPVQLVTSDANGNLATNSASNLGLASEAEINAINFRLNDIDLKRSKVSQWLSPWQAYPGSYRPSASLSLEIGAHFKGGTGLRSTAQYV
jgi:hypothetical protein